MNTHLAQLRMLDPSLASNLHKSSPNHKQAFSHGNLSSTPDIYTMTRTKRSIRPGFQNSRVGATEYLEARQRRHEKQ